MKTKRKSKTASDRQTEIRFRPPAIRAFFDEDGADPIGGLIVDNFAGGGGASSGIARAFGRDPDLAINHDADAIAMHKANHPTTRHFTEDVWDVDPIAATGGRPVAFAWFSPDCKHFSRAKGGKPRDQKIRGLAWSAVRWARAVRPAVICLENVPEFKEWGPIYKDHSPSCARRREGKRDTVCLETCHFGKPIVEKRGQTYRAWRRRLERLGYTCEERMLRACDYGAPTSRYRYFFVARCDGKPIVWPEPTHGPGRAQPYRTAAEVIDWSIPTPSIFDRKKALSPKTMARIARGIDKFVLNTARPFIIPVNHGGVGRRDLRVHDIDQPIPTITGGQRGSHAVIAPHLTKYYGASESAGAGQYQSAEAPVDTVTSKARFGVISPVLLKAKTHGGGGNGAKPADEPLGTITTSKRGEFAVAVPYMVHRSNGERPGQAPRIYDIQKPIGTLVGQGLKHAIVTAFLEKGYSEQEGGWNGGQDVHRPIGTITQRDHHRAITVTLTEAAANEEHAFDLERAHQVYAFFVKFAGTSPAHVASSAFGADEPMPTITASANTKGGSGGKFGLVTVTIAGEPYVIVDIGMRMLTPPELFLAQGFDESYVIDPVGPSGKRLTKTAQIKMCGNSVPPPFSEALARANRPDLVHPPVREAA